MRLAAAHSLGSHVCEPSLPSTGRKTCGSAGRKCPHTASKPLRIPQSILCGLFLVCEHFCSGRTASHRTALDFRGIFVLLDAGGLSPAKEKRAKSTGKTGRPTCVPLLIDALSAEDRGECLGHAPEKAADAVPDRSGGGQGALAALADLLHRFGQVLHALGKV